MGDNRPYGWGDRRYTDIRNTDAGKDVLWERRAAGRQIRRALTGIPWPRLSSLLMMPSRIMRLHTGDRHFQFSVLRVRGKRPLP